MRQTKADKEIERLFKKRVGNLTVPEIKFLFVYFKLMDATEELRVKFVPKKRKK